ncbi:hypothetical protein FOS14_20550 [Skermania sp. ID1734]|uniref:hypothetical protein n=1 Tax=Skermania sp. ID1734 TaxID=2597516 RepID=UPI00117F2132|nr:hypothetical protein [Skermania sp. ID1734]TSD94417.1 hypothetical protein FOS14_20550 [Skermania sp. ID1734]
MSVTPKAIRRFCMLSGALLATLALATSVSAAAPFPAATPVVSDDLTPNPSGKVAEPADDVAHPGVTTEWWYASFMDPASLRQFVVAIFTAPVPMVAATMMYADGTSPVSRSAQVPVPFAGDPHGGPVADGQPGVRTSGGEISYDRARHAYHVRLNSSVRGDVWLDRGQLPGATGIIDLRNQGQWMGWTSPVATSTVTGWVQMPNGQPIDVTGWRGYHDHNWGNFTMVDQAADGWEWGLSHEPDGGASIIGGLVRRGGQWTGAVVDVRPGGTRVCTSSTLSLTDWVSGPTPLSGSTFALPGTITATCGPRERYHFTKTFHLTEPVVADEGVLAASFEAPYTTVPDSHGMFEHIRSLLARIEQAQR